MNFHTGTLLLIALVCEKFDNYGDEFTDTIMKYYTPEQLTSAKSRVDFSTDDNMKLVELLAISIESDDREEIEEEVTYQLFKLDRKMNKLFKGKKSELNAVKNESVDSPGRTTQIFVMSDFEMLTFHVYFCFFVSCFLFGFFIATL